MLNFVSLLFKVTLTLSGESSQRPAFQRLNKLVTILDGYGDPEITDIFDDSKADDVWNTAVLRFNAEWRNVPLTTVIKRSRF